MLRKIVESKNDIWVVTDDSHMPNALTTEGMVFGISNFSLFQKAIEKDKNPDYNKYIFSDKNAATWMAKRGHLDFGTFKVTKLKIRN